MSREEYKLTVNTGGELGDLLESLLRANNVKDTESRRDLTRAIFEYVGKIQRAAIEKEFDYAKLLINRHDLENELNELKEWAKKASQYLPKHGPCCTCQVCGKHYDDCRCTEDELHQEIDKLKQQLEHSQDKWNTACKTCGKLLVLTHVTYCSECYGHGASIAAEEE
jgi:hypothetical protein